MLLIPRTKEKKRIPRQDLYYVPQGLFLRISEPSLKYSTIAYNFNHLDFNFLFPFDAE
jgi:hypothetical protein